MMLLRTLAVLAFMLPVAAPAAGFRTSVGLRSAPDVDARPSRQAKGFDLQPAGFTPYDRYLGSVRTVFANLDTRRPTSADACRLLRISRAFRYESPRDPYRADPPALTAKRKAGDCKAKALWLYDKLGDPTAHYVIGKLTPRARSSHAWLYWKYDGRWWILDPTNLSNPIAADTVGRTRYVPYYSFTRGASYRHAATRLLLGPQTVAARE